MKQYIDLLKDILENGKEREDRTGTGTIGVFGRQIRFDLKKGFPLVTTKKMFTRGIIEELLFFLQGETNIKYLVDKGVNIWNQNAYDFYKRSMPKDLAISYSKFIDHIKNGNHTFGWIGNQSYGGAWREWDGGRVDQIKEAIDSLKNNPFSRRIIVTAWNPNEVDKVALPPCHCFFQFFVEINKEGKKELSLQLYQRSCDSFLGLPYNISSYCFLLHIIAKHVGCEVGEFIHTFGDLHIYKNHIEQVKEQISREPFELPTIEIRKELKELCDIESLSAEDFEIKNYQCHPTIKGEMSV